MTNSTARVAIISLAAVILMGLMTISFGTDSHSSAKGFVAVVALAVVGVGIVSGLHYLTVKRETRAQLAGGENYRQLADEYRRLADLAITAQEHTDLKMGEISAQLDFLRRQNESLQKILRDVE